MRRIRLAGVIHRPGLWGMCDQCLSSGTNLFLTLIVVRSVSIPEFGTFSVAYIVYTLALGLARALVFEPIVIREARSEEDGEPSSRDALGVSVTVGVTVGTALACGGLILGDEAASGLVSMAAILPLLLVQDGVRGIWYSRGLHRNAALNDLLWALGALISLLLVSAIQNDPPVWLLIAAWGLPGTLAGLWGLKSVGGGLTISAGRGWFVGHGGLIASLLLDYCVTVGVAQACFALVALVAGIEELGLMRAALVPLGFLNVLYTGTRLVTLPSMSRQGESGEMSVKAIRLPVAVSATMGTIALMWSVFIWLMPGVVRVVVGENWDSARQVFLAVAGVLVAQGVTVGADIALRGSRRPFDLARARLMSAPVTLICTSSGAMASGALGASLGMGIGYLFTSGMLWRYVIREGESGRRPSPELTLSQDS